MTPGRTIRRVPDEWYVGFHRGLAARFWRAAAATMAAKDGQIVGHLLDLTPGSTVLDVPCGDGRLTRRLAAHGYGAIGRAAHHVHTGGEVVRLLKAAGFADTVLLGGDGAAQYEFGSPRLIVTATAGGGTGAGPGGSSS